MENRITGLDFIGVPSRDADKLITFYTEILELRSDEKTKHEFWVGDTCFGVWEPERIGIPFAPQKNAHIALHVDDIIAARAELEAKGITFLGETLENPLCYMALFTDPDGNDLMLHQLRENK